MIERLLNQFKNNTFLVASLYSGFAAISKILSAVIIAKIVAIILGPEGLALIGQLNSFILLSITLAGTAISQGIVKYVAQYAKEDITKLNTMIGVSLKIIVSSSLLLAILLIIFSSVLSSYILLDAKYYFVFILLGCTILLSGFNSLFTSVLNGFKQFKKFNQITIISNLFGLFITVLLIYFYHIEGVLISLALNQTVIFFVTYFYIRKEPWYAVRKFYEMPFHKGIGIDLLKYAALSLFSTILVPIVTILIRKIIINEESLTAAGYYEFMLRISSVTLMFFSIMISTYYIPRISEIFTVKELKKEVINTYKIIIPLLIVILGGIFVCRYFIIKLLATEDFMLVSPMFTWQLLADFFKVSAQIISFILVAKALIKLAIVVEVIFNVTNFTLCYLLIPIYGYKVVFIINLVMCLSYFIAFILIYKFVILNVKKHNILKE
ncbi:MAG: O-antigen translocase [Flavobacteriaceae bacterium]|jgi:PST family polysaccharide transporter|nr:O-antigen translocase [Flavobacteriaceae bacterium]